jgi:hypothetical protein
MENENKKDLHEEGLKKIEREVKITEVLQGLTVSEALIVLKDVQFYIETKSIVPSAVLTYHTRSE